MVDDPEKGVVEASHCPSQDSDSHLKEVGRDLSREVVGSRRDTDEESTHSRGSIDTIEPVEEEGEAVRNVQSNASSVPGPLVIVPRDKRRGLLGRLALIPEVENPHLYSNKTKWLHTMFVALAAAAAPMGSAIFLPSLPQLALDLNASPTVTNLSVASYMLSMAIFPLWWSSFSETLGRRSIYLTSFVLFTIWSIASALSTSIGMLVVMRCLSGGAAAAVQAVGAGSVADLWEVRERGRAMGIFYLGPLLGPLLAPIIGGGLAQAWSWRATQWFQAIYGGLIIILITLFLPETLMVQKDTPLALSENEKSPAMQAPLARVSTKQSVRIKTKKATKIFKRCIIDPLSVLLYLRFPAVLLTVYLASIAFGTLFVLNISVQETFSAPPYSFKVSIVGLVYIPPSVGYITASIVGGRWTDYIMAREAKAANRFDHKGKLIYHPEDRLRENAYFAAVVFPGALIWYGWTVRYGVHWIAPMIANFFFGLGSMIIFGVAATMLTEFMPKRSSSGVAVNNFVRNTFSAVGAVVASPLIGALGNGWLFTLLGLVCWVSALGVVWAMRQFGPRWRAKMERELNMSH